MIIKGITDEDIVNYKQMSMYIAFPYCSFKCEKECGTKCCQNSELNKAENIAVEIDKLVDRYLDNNITSAIVMGGLEPFDSWQDVLDFITAFRKKSQDTIVIYTGYYADEIADKIKILQKYPNIVVKFGRFIPNQAHHLDSVLGIELASANQYAVKIS